MSDILIISTNNIARGPMLEGFLRERLKRAAAGFSCVSRGINVVAPSRSNPRAAAVMKDEFGADIGAHIARALTTEDLGAARTIICVSTQHLRYLEAVYPNYAAKARLVLGAEGEGVEPVSGDDGLAYKMCAEYLRDYVERLDLGEIFGE